MLPIRSARHIHEPLALITMRTMQIFLTSILLMITGLVTGQEFEEIIIPFDSTLVIPNPFQSELDSLKLRVNDVNSKIEEEGASVYVEQEVLPTFYSITQNGDTLSLNEYLTVSYKGNSVSNFTAYFQIQVDWKGSIQFVGLLRSTGNIDDQFFNELFEGLRAKPGTLWGIPTNQKVTIPIKSTNASKG